MLIATPDIVTVKLGEEIDFIVLGCDGIFDQMTNQEVVDCIWMTTRDAKMKNVHQQCGVAVDMVMKTSLVRRSLDNVTVLLIAFSNFERGFISKENSLARKTRDNNISNDFTIMNTNSTQDEVTSKKLVNSIKPSNELNSKALIHKKLSDDLKGTFDEKKKIFEESRNNDEKIENDVPFHKNVSHDHVHPLRFPSSSKFKESKAKTLNNLNNKKFHFLDNRKVVLKGHHLRTDGPDEAIYLSTKKANLHSSEMIIEKLNALPDSTRNLKTNTDFFKLKSKLQLSKK